MAAVASYPHGEMVVLIMLLHALKYEEKLSAPAFESTARREIYSAS